MKAPVEDVLQKEPTLALAAFDAQGDFSDVLARVQRRRHRQDLRDALMVLAIVALPISAVVQPFWQAWHEARVQREAQVAAWQAQLQPELTPVIAEGKDWAILAGDLQSSYASMQKETDAHAE